jgi:hypothetical protein
LNIFGICIVKNEADIIEYSLTKSCEWATRIFVVDNASSDDTWERVLSLSRINSKIVPWKVTNELFHDGMRADVFNQFRHLSKENDWWCLFLDCDEFYIDNPLTFLQNTEKFAHVVCSKHIQYRLTTEDVSSFDFNMKIEKVMAHMKYFEKEATSEIRFFKYRNRIQWDENNVVPKHIGIVSQKRILVRHYQYRSPEQIQKRIQTRMELKQRNTEIFPHVHSENWMDYVLPKESCILDKCEYKQYQDLPFHKHVILGYRPWVLLIRRFFHFIKIFP